MTHDGTPRRIALIREEASDGLPHAVCFTRFAAQVLLAEIDRLTAQLADGTSGRLFGERNQALAERDQARDIARGLRRLHHANWPVGDDPEGADWRIEAALALDLLPDWLTADAAPDGAGNTVKSVRLMTPADVTRGETEACIGCGTQVSVHGHDGLPVGYVTSEGVSCNSCCDAVLDGEAQ